MTLLVLVALALAAAFLWSLCAPLRAGETRAHRSAVIVLVGALAAVAAAVVVVAALVRTARAIGGPR